MALTERRRLGLLAVVAGLALAAVSRLAVPGAPPLYDGVVVNEPYRWLEPPQGALGGAQGASGTAILQDGASPLIALATPEQPPQAQVFAPPGAFTLPAGTTSLVMSISPIPPPGQPSSGRIAGNVYRFTIASQDGAPVSAPAEAFVSVVMRGPEDLFDAAIARFADGRWQSLDTSHAGYTNGFLAIVTEFGDFALIGEGSAPTSTPTSTASPAPTDGTPLGVPLPVLAVALGAAGVVLAGLAFWLYRSSRPMPAPPSTRGRRRRRRR